MKDSLKSFFRSCIPPLVYDLKSRLANNAVAWHGNYDTWKKAADNSRGYDDTTVIERVADSMRQIVSGKAAFERDSVLFDEIQYSWPVLAGLLEAALMNEGRLNVLDFGGALGSSYYQNLKFLEEVKQITWNIIEQEKFVECGKKEFETEELRFFYNIEDASQNGELNVILLSGLLPYVENPYAILEELLKLNSMIIIIDRTPMLSGENDRLTVQETPGVIYNTSYPAWFFSEKKLMQYMTKKYSPLASFDTLGGKIKIRKPALNAMTKGYIFKLKKAG